MQTTGISAARSITSGPRSADFAFRHLLAALFCLPTIGVVSAQGTTTEAELRGIDASRRQQEREQDQRQRLLRPPEVRLQPAAIASSRLPRDESPCFQIQAIDLIGPAKDALTPDAPPEELPSGWTTWLLDALDAGTPQDPVGRPLVARPDADSPLYQRSGICLGSQLHRQEGRIIDQDGQSGA